MGKEAIAYWLNSLCPSCLCGSILKKLSWRSLFYFWISDRFFIGQWAIAFLLGSKRSLFGEFEGRSRVVQKPGFLF
ncbi:hypothetical protein [Planktothricoides raciborskii]|uniref:Uncharacterized protein n=2 Tax=Planktothricoides raciborskii TaxID=132608 RepID=A0AAU8JGW9_9CYAN|nr:hypothetical protein [Planktothricoides raciborskii]MBD2546621.1 hypothetical protein [Planktothricoides raciborskii FACHB-1370]MBD2585123.1 hypothetical protein [Planktothricoides raciborskii FACHB-1261]